MRSVVVMCLSMFSIAGAHAADFTAPLLNETGKPFTVCIRYDPPSGPSKACAEETPLSVGQAIFDALNQPESLTNDGVIARGNLALKIREAKDLEITANERDVIKAALFSAVQKLGYRPVAVVQVLKIIDPAAVK